MVRGQAFGEPKQGVHITPTYSDILEMTVIVTMLMGPHCLPSTARESCHPEAVLQKLGGGMACAKAPGWLPESLLKWYYLS